MPGASRIKVVFDPRSRTALDCDWLSIVQEPDGVSASQNQEQRGNSGRYHGRGGRENFPGFGGRPPLWLKGDRFVARFHSGLNTTDWGVRFTAYGFLDGGSGDGRDSNHAQRAASWTSRNTLDDRSERGVTVSSGARGGNRAPKAGEAKARAATTRRTGALDVELCCWLLEILSHEGREISELTACLCDKHALGVYQECLQVFSQRRQLRVLRLITCVIAEARVPSTYRSLPQPFATAFPVSDNNSRNGHLAMRPSASHADAALKVILAQITTQQTIEGDPSTMSPYLQALVQCAARLCSFPGSDGELSNNRLANESRIEAPPPATLGRNTLAGETDVEAPGPATPKRDRQMRRTVAIAPGIEADVSVSPERSGSLAERLLRTGPSVEAVKGIATVWAALSDFFQGTAPTRMLLKEFLPILTEAFSVTVQSTHPFDLVAKHRVIAVPGATEMLARFDHRTEMREDDRVVIRAPRRHSTAGSSETATRSQVISSFASQTTKAAIAIGNLLRDGDELSLCGLVGGTNTEELPHISVGDLVVRGPDWTFGDEDDGAEQAFPTENDSTPRARVGVVIALEKWGKCEGAGARVRWGGRTNVGPTGAVGGHRELGKGFEALYSVRCPAHIRVVNRGGPDQARRPVIAAGDSLELGIIPAGAERGVGGSYEPTGHANGSGTVGKRSSVQCIRFDGESTYVDLPRYRGMRLEGDFTLEIWVWLDPGAACDGKKKCVFSRAFDHPQHQSRHASTRDREVSDKGAKASPVFVGQGRASRFSSGEKDETGVGPEERGGHPPAFSDVVHGAASAIVGGKGLPPDLHFSSPQNNGAPSGNLSGGLTTPGVSTGIGGAVTGRGTVVAGDFAPSRVEAGTHSGVGYSGEGRAMAAAGTHKGNDDVKEEEKEGEKGGDGGGKPTHLKRNGFVDVEGVSIPFFDGKTLPLQGGTDRSSDDSADLGNVEEDAVSLLEEEEEEEGGEEEEEGGGDDDDGGDTPVDGNVEEKEGATLAGAAAAVAPDDGNGGVPRTHASEDASTSRQVRPP